MKTITRLLLCVCLILPLAACNDDKSTQQEERAPLTAPLTGDSRAWQAYISDVAGRHMEGIDRSPFVYLVPEESSDRFQNGGYDRLVEEARLAVQRGIVRGNMIIYAGTNSTHVADLVEMAFNEVTEGSMNGVRVLFIGDAVDSDRVSTAVAPAGVEYVFIEK